MFCGEFNWNTYWIFKSSEMWHYAVGQVKCPPLSSYVAILPGLLAPEDEDTITHWHIRKNSPSNITPHPENLNLQQHHCEKLKLLHKVLTPFTASNNMQPPLNYTTTCLAHEVFEFENPPLAQKGSEFIIQYYG